jgi:hypothetical protein
VLHRKTAKRLFAGSILVSCSAVSFARAIKASLPS